MEKYQVDEVEKKIKYLVRLGSKMLKFDFGLRIMKSFIFGRKFVRI